MADGDTSLPELGDLIEQRLALLRRLAESLEFSRLALARNDAEAIARGAAHQAELCRQWSCLEGQILEGQINEGQINDELRSEAGQHMAPPTVDAASHSPESESSARLQAEWAALTARIRHLTRVHWSLLCHMQRSLAVLNRVLESSSAPAYMPDPGLLRPQVRLRAGE
jgi:hypothetical protein